MVIDVVKFKCILCHIVTTNSVATPPRRVWFTSTRQAHILGDASSGFIFRLFLYVSTPVREWLPVMDGG